MKNLNLLLLLFLTAVITKAQTPTEEWVARYNNPQANGTDVFLDMVVDTDGNSYVCGYSDGQTTGVDIVVAKFEVDGDTAWGAPTWVYRYQGTGEDKAVAMALTSNNDVVVTGHSESQSNGWDIITIKINGATGLAESGWPQIYDGDEHSIDFGNDVAVRQTDNFIAVCGSKEGSDGTEDVALLFYDPFGSLNFEGIQDWHGNLNIDNANVFCHFFNNGNLGVLSYVTGGGFGTDYQAYFDVVNGNNGSLVDYGYLGDGDSPDYFSSYLFRDIYFYNNAIYILIDWISYNTVYGNAAYKLVSTDDQFISPVFYEVYDEPNGNATGIVVNSSRIYISGYEDVSSFSAIDLNGFVTVYNQNGDFQWRENYGGTQDDGFYDISIDQASNANVYVTGFTTNSGNKNIVTAKYDYTGQLEWDTIYNGIANNIDEAYNIHVGTGNTTGSIWVSGKSRGTQDDGIVIKYCVPPVVTLTALADVCEEDAAFTLSGGSPTVGAYSGVGVNNNMFDPGVAGPGTHTIRYTYTNQNGCSDYDEKGIVVHPTPPVPTVTASGALQFCAGNSVVLNAPPNYTSYDWNPGTTTTEALTVTSTTTTPTTTYNYTVTVTDQYGCQNTSIATTVTVNGNPTVNITGTNYYCTGSTTTLNANAQAGSGTITGYQWSPNGETATSIPVSTANNFTVTVTNSNTCSTTSSATTVTEAFPPATPTVSASGTPEFCEGDDIVLTTNGSNCNGCTFTWNPNGGTGLNYTATESGSYTVTASNNCGTEVSAPVVVTVHPLPIASVGNDQTICSGESIELLNSGTGVCSWLPATHLSHPDSCITTASPTSDIMYIVTVTDTATGCFDKDTVNINVISGQVPVPQFTFTYNQTGGPTVTFDLTNQNDYDNVTWDFGDGSNTSTTIDPIHQYTGNGDFIVTLTGCITCTDTVLCNSSNQLVSISVGIDEYYKFPVLIYPNPASHSIFIQTENRMNLFYLQDVTGKLLLQGSFNSSSTQIEINSLDAGIYFLNLQNEQGSVTKKVQVIR